MFHATLVNIFVQLVHFPDVSIVLTPVFLPQIGQFICFKSTPP